MSVLLCLNEHSCTHELREDEVTAAMRRFVTAVRAIQPRATLVTPLKLPHIELAPGYPMARWADRNKDLWRALRMLQDRAPYSYAELVSERDRDVEYHLEGTRAEGLGLAHSHDGLAVSLPTAHRWDRTEIPIDRTWFDEAADAVGEEVVEVRHLSATEHLTVHRAWFDEVRYRAAITEGSQLWSGHAELFPALTFLPGVAEHLTALDPRWVQPVFGRLKELQEMVVEWRTDGSTEPRWRSKVSPEHDGRRDLCWFEDLDGVTRLFDTHLRFTPGAGRLHLRVVFEDRTVRIAWIGPKIGS
ncbi:hypothetical protein [Nocardia caishijiensis]|uniref:Uncharacterized protein n=1 Tax=Nocardia caishijiensis TaxID=184756 RepID=A0ABQ6YFW1_9NOCA|nr:hypothetical protein [Nocardia caishijiensis]KAF0842483.1 hypothetical protein FNL39_11164 [Nocardia caishijiensis]